VDTLKLEMIRGHLYVTHRDTGLSIWPSTRHARDLLFVLEIIDLIGE